MPPRIDLVCLSHLRWDWVYQRPQHLLTRAAKDWRVFVVEEPVVSEDGLCHLRIVQRADNLWTAVPEIPDGLNDEELVNAQRDLLDHLLTTNRVDNPVLWYYTPMALPFSRHIPAAATVYDCMDELSLFKNAPASLRANERELLLRADLVFTGGHMLYEAKRSSHSSVYAFPSSVDAAHFGRARTPLPEPGDQAAIPRPRLGFFGVLDERLDLDLLAEIAARRPDWQLVLVGPIAKISPADLPQGANVHLLGPKTYDELPSYLAGWDVALMPFAHNEATRFISPTKTPEYLAGGKPVVSTSIHDVVHPYGDRGLVRIADTADDLIAAIEESLQEGPRESWLEAVNDFLAQSSWDHSWARMKHLLLSSIALRGQTAVALDKDGLTFDGVDIYSPSSDLVTETPAPRAAR